MSPLKKFRLTLKNDHLPDFHVKYDVDSDKVTFFNRHNFTFYKKIESESKLILKTSTYEEAKKITPNYDIYYLEQMFFDWIKNKPSADNIDAAFIGFCKAVNKNQVA